MNLLKKVSDYCNGGGCHSCELVQYCESITNPPDGWDLSKTPSFDYQAVINHYGNQAQITVTQEELAELIQSLSKAIRTDIGTARESVLEELGDVTLCLEYIKLIFGITERDIREQIKFKQERLLKEMGK